MGIASGSLVHTLAAGFDCPCCSPHNRCWRSILCQMLGAVYLIYLGVGAVQCQTRRRYQPDNAQTSFQSDRIRSIDPSFFHSIVSSFIIVHPCECSFPSFHSIPFHSIPSFFHSIPFPIHHSIGKTGSILFHDSIILNTNSMLRLFIFISIVICHPADVPALSTIHEPDSSDPKGW